MCLLTGKFLGKEKKEYTFWARASSRSSSRLSSSSGRSCNGSGLIGEGILAAGGGGGGARGGGDGVLGIMSISFSASECQIKPTLPCVTLRHWRTHFWNSI